MKKGLVSVVLPVYNVEKYLDRCIRSVVNQSYNNLEIILVDDESPDNSPYICEEWKKKDSRIKVIHKKNQGLGCARNTGIENATGEYICFIDSDDYIALDTIEKAYSLAKDENSDVVSYGYNQVNSEGVTVNAYIPCPKKLVFENEEVQNEFLPSVIAPDTVNGEYTNLWMSICGALFSMDLVKKCNWKSESERKIISEDVFSLLYLYKYVKKVSVLPESLYFYCENSCSLTHIYRDDRYEKIKFSYLECLKLCDELTLNSNVKKRLLYPYFSNTIAAMKTIVKSNLSERKKDTHLNLIIKDKFLRDSIDLKQLNKEKLNRKILLLLIYFRLYKISKFLIKLKA